MVRFLKNFEIIKQKIKCLKIGTSEGDAGTEVSNRRPGADQLRRRVQERFRRKGR